MTVTDQLATAIAVGDALAYATTLEDKPAQTTAVGDTQGYPPIQSDNE